MPGGPINGSGVYGQTLLKTNPAAAIIVPTVLQITADTIDSFLNVTCLYDRYWTPRNDVATFPMCMFYVKSINQTRQVETSEQRVILYEPQEKLQQAAMAKGVRPGVQSVITDNIVKKPKTYQMEIIVPYQLVGNQFVRTVREAQELIDAFTEIYSGVAPLEKAISSLPVLQQLLQAGGKVVDIAAKFPGTNAANSTATTINMNSLEAMVDSGRVLTMKMWTGYDYKYVILTGLDFKKQGNEDNVFRATLSLKEMPILTVTPVSDAKNAKNIDLSWAAQAVSLTGRILLEPLKVMTGVGKASGE